MKKAGLAMLLVICLIISGCSANQDPNTIRLKEIKWSIGKEEFIKQRGEPLTDLTYPATNGGMSEVILGYSGKHELVPDDMFARSKEVPGAPQPSNTSFMFQDDRLISAGSFLYFDELTMNDYQTMHDICVKEFGDSVNTFVQTFQCANICYALFGSTMHYSWEDFKRVHGEDLPASVVEQYVKGDVTIFMSVHFNGLNPAYMASPDDPNPPMLSIEYQVAG